MLNFQTAPDNKLVYKNTEVSRKLTDEEHRFVMKKWCGAFVLLCNFTLSRYEYANFEYELLSPFFPQLQS